MVVVLSNFHLIKIKALLSPENWKYINILLRNIKLFWFVHKWRGPGREKKTKNTATSSCKVAEGEGRLKFGKIVLTFLFNTPIVKRSISSRQGSARSLCMWVQVRSRWLIIVGKEIRQIYFGRLIFVRLFFTNRQIRSLYLF